MPAAKNDTEAAYLEAILTNNEKKLRKLYAEFLPRIAYLIRQNGGSEDDARDIFQDALIVIYRKAKAGNLPLTSKFYTLLYGICRNLWGNQLQKKSRTEVRITDERNFEHIAADDPQLKSVEEERLFWDAFGQLGQGCQDLLRLFFQKIKMEEITSRLGISSVGYAKKKKFKCKEQLIALVKQDRRYAELKIS